MLYIQVKVRHYCDNAEAITDEYVKLITVDHDTYNDITPALGCALECDCGDTHPTFLITHNGMIPIHQYPDAELGDVVEWTSW